MSTVTAYHDHISVTNEDIVAVAAAAAGVESKIGRNPAGTIDDLCQRAADDAPPSNGQGWGMDGECRGKSKGNMAP